MYNHDWETALSVWFLLVAMCFMCGLVVGWLPAMLGVSPFLVAYLVWFIQCHDTIIEDVQTWWEFVVQETASDLRDWLKEKREDTAEWAADKLEDVANWANERKSDLRYWLANR
jgi:ribose/xylose/arabinose/galactoside ABC-type transport system permease subunit